MSDMTVDEQKSSLTMMLGQRKRKSVKKEGHFFPQFASVIIDKKERRNKYKLVDITRHV